MATFWSNEPVSASVTISTARAPSRAERSVAAWISARSAELDEPALT